MTMPMYTMVHDHEEWRPIQKYAGYQVSRSGRVRRLDYVKNYSDGSSESGPAKMLVTHMDGENVVVNFKSKCHLVHILVADAFLSDKKPNASCVIRFKDNNKMNVCADNLEWITLSEITKQAIAEGKRKPPAPYGGVQIKCIESGTVYPSIQSLCDYLNISRPYLMKHIRTGESINGNTYVKM